MSGISGYDFTGIVEQMVASYRLPADQMIKTENKLTAQKDAWREVNTSLKSLNDALTNLYYASTWAASKTSTSNQNLLTASSTAVAIKGAYNINIANTAQAQTVVSSLNFADQTSAIVPLTPGKFDITVGGVTKSISVVAGDSLTTLAASINNAKAGVTASIIQDGAGYKLAIITEKTGLANVATFTNDVTTPGVIESLGLDASLVTTQPALDAHITINGISVTSSTNTVTTAIPGVTLNLIGTGDVSLNVSQDNSVAQKAAQDFIDKYNSVMDLITKDLSYNKETKETGKLFGDQTLQGIQARLRRIVTATQNISSEPYLTLSSIGIMTVSAADAKLTLDTAKFNKAMEENPQSVANLFGAPAGGVTPDKTPATAQGLANVLKAYLKPMVEYDGAMSKKQDNFAKQLKDIDTRITNFEARVSSYQDMLKKKFSSLETLLTQLNQQSSWLTSQVTSMNKSA